MACSHAVLAYITHCSRAHATCRLRFATNFSDLYEIGSYLGQGSFGAVHEVIERATGLRYAAKRILKV
jgi:serine/threonine protein kinase